jgi:hypothetical protein
MAAITPEQAQGYLDRWKLVRDAETAELRNTSFEIKLQQLGILMASRELFGADESREILVRTVRERWARIRRSFNE